MAEFIPVDTGGAKEFLKNNHYGVLATRRKNGGLQMSPVTCGLDSVGRAVISRSNFEYRTVGIQNLTVTNEGYGKGARISGIEVTTGGIFSYSVATTATGYAGIGFQISVSGATRPPSRNLR